MISEGESIRDREVPHFFAEWRAKFERDGELRPLDYLSMEHGLPFVIAAQWLFCPNFVEYRDCVVVVKTGDDEGNLADQKDNYEQYLPALARSVARCWEGLLTVRFPDRRFTVEVYGDSASELDPNITFYTSTP